MEAPFWPSPRGKETKTTENKQDHSEILTKIFSYFPNGLNSGVTIKPKEYLQERGLDYKLLETGYNSGQFPRCRMIVPKIRMSQFCRQYS